MRYSPRQFVPILLLAFAVSSVGSQDLAFSIGTWSFFRDKSGAWPSGGPGSFASFGLTYGLTPRLEAGISLVPRMAPDPFDDILAEGHVGLSLFGDRISGSGAPAIYINTLADIGFILGAHNVYSGTTEYSKAVFVRLTPISLGNPYYGRRDRIFSVGLLYNFDTASASLFINLVAADFFLAAGAKFH